MKWLLCLIFSTKHPNDKTNDYWLIPASKKLAIENNK